MGKKTPTPYEQYGVHPIKDFYCQKVLPLVYDNSLSYYEVLCKAVGKLNEVINVINIWRPIAVRTKYIPNRERLVVFVDYPKVKRYK